MIRWLLAVVVVLGANPVVARADDPPVSVADLPAYQAALAARIDRESTPTVTFRDLWDHPEAHQGQPVRVEGRLARLFRQPGIGQFPALTEAWVTSPLGEPICLVFPSGSSANGPQLGDRVRFAGTFLRRITYPRRRHFPRRPSGSWPGSARDG